MGRRRATPGTRATHLRPASEQKPPASMRFLFTTLGYIESDFYARVGRELQRCGHDVAQLTFSRRAALVMRRRGMRTWCLPDVMRSLPPIDDLDAEVRRAEARYDVPTFRDIYRADIACRGADERTCLMRTVRQLRAVEAVFDEWAPDIAIPEVGSETIRVGTDLVARRRDVPVLFLFFTIFPDPLRMYVDTMDAPIVALSELREPTADENERLDAFIAEFTTRREPIRPARDARLTRHRAAMLARHVGVKVIWDRDNEYLRPLSWLAGRARERVSTRIAMRAYEGLPDGPFVYFPLHLVDDYKIQRVVPHCADQGALIEQVSRALPHGIRLVVKEHPMSIGRTPLALLRRLHRLHNVRVVAPQMNSHDLVERSRAVIVIGSTVGLEALLYNKPVMTLGQPFYAGLGATVDLRSFAEIRDAVPRLLEHQPDHRAIRRLLVASMRHCLPGVPVLVDGSDRNAAVLAESLGLVARREHRRRRGGGPQPAWADHRADGKSARISDP